MDILKSWAYVDNSNNIWKFSVNSDEKLQYSIMYEDKKWTEKKIIDQDVQGYCIYVDKNGVHIIYSNSKAELKYCTFNGQQWMGKTLYKLDKQKVEIKNLNVILTNEEIHIFYLLKDNKSNGHGIIMHCKWNGIETNFDKLQDIIITPGLNEHYLVLLDGKYNIEMLFLSDEGNEVSLNYCSYKNKRWTDANRLYGISGDNIEIKMLKDQYGMHILNKCKEDLEHFIVHVFVKKSGDVQKSNVYESKNIISEPILLKEDNKICTYWIEDNKIYSSFFRGKDWSNPICVIDDVEQDIKKYNYVKRNKNNISKIKEIYWIGETDINKIILGEIGTKNKEQLINEVEETQENLNKEEVFKKDDDIKRISLLNSLGAENKLMKETIASLNLQLQNKQNILNDYEEQVSKIIHYKQKAEDNYNIFIEVQNKLQKELEEIKNSYEEEKVKRENAEILVKEMEEDKIAIKEQVNRLIEEISGLIEDNKRLSKELENIKNKSSAKGFWKF